MRFRLGATLLGNRDMRLFLAAQGLDSVAIGVASVALPWLVLSEGHSVGLAGLVYPLTIVPFVVFGLPAGARKPGQAVWQTNGTQCHHLPHICN